MSLRATVLLCYGATVYFLTALPQRCQAEQMTGIIHLHSTYSAKGVHTLEEIVERAKAKNIDVVFFTDHALARWEYGVWPLRGLLRRMVQQRSILTIGPEKYLSEIQRLQAKYPDMLLIPGAECTPHYFWSGTPWKDKLTLHQWHEHLLAVGLWKPEDFKALALSSNPFLPLSTRQIFCLAFWAAVLVSGMFVFARHSMIGILMLLLGGLGSFNTALAGHDRHSLYQNAGSAPYQDFIDGVRARGGLVFWNHPEAPNWEKPVASGPVMIQTKPYPDALLTTSDYTGFAALFEGRKIVSLPGGYWDKLLMAYCQGSRKRPVWAIGELDWRKDGENETLIDTIRLVFDTQDRTAAGVLRAMSQGRMHVVLKGKKNSLRLDEFTATSIGLSAQEGEELRSVAPLIHLRVGHTGNAPASIKVDLVRDGVVIESRKGQTPYDFEFLDKTMPPKKSYYRAEVSDTLDSGLILTNPIFVNGGISL